MPVLAGPHVRPPADALRARHRPAGPLGPRPVGAEPTAGCGSARSRRTPPRSSRTRPPAHVPALAAAPTTPPDPRQSSVNHPPVNATAHRVMAASGPAGRCAPPEASQHIGALRPDQYRHLDGIPSPARLSCRPGGTAWFPDPGHLVRGRTWARPSHPRPRASASCRRRAESGRARGAPRGGDRLLRRVQALTTPPSTRGMNRSTSGPTTATTGAYRTLVVRDDGIGGGLRRGSGMIGLKPGRGTRRDNSPLSPPAAGEPCTSTFQPSAAKSEQRPARSRGSGDDLAANLHARRPRSTSRTSHPADPALGQVFTLGTVTASGIPAGSAVGRPGWSDPPGWSSLLPDGKS